MTRKDLILRKTEQPTNQPQLFICTHLKGYTYDFLVSDLLVISFSIELELIGLDTKIAVVSTQLNGFNNCHQTLKILFTIKDFCTE